MSLQYRADIDGLRAVAVLAVVLFHLGVPLISGGFIGVDIFFVLSGFLITSILKNDISNNQFSLLKFWERRIRRIAPALFFVVIFCLLAGWYLLLPDDFKRLSQQVFSVSTFSSNILFYLQSGYFDADNETKPLLHTWSLSVEEQFYFIFPLALYGFKKFFSSSTLKILVSLFLISLVTSIYGVYTYPSATFYLLPTRMWELLLGAIISFCPPRPTLSHKHMELCSFLALILIGISIFVFNKDTPIPGWAALIPCLSVGLLIWIGSTYRSLISKFLSLKPLVFAGKISYSWYLWHWPIIVFYKYAYGLNLSPFEMIIIFVLTLILSILSWRFVETPFRNKKGRNYISAPSLLKLWGLFSIAFIVIGIMGHANNGYRDFYIKNRLTQSEANTFRLVQISTNYDIYDHMFDNQDCIFWARETHQTFIDRFEKCSKKYGQAVVILGDSHAMNLFNISGKSGAYPFTVGVSQGGCRVHHNKKQCHYDGFLNFLKSYKHYIKLIIYHQSGSYLIQDRNGNADSPLAFEEGHPYKILTHDIESVLDYVAKLNQIVRTVWAGPFVEARIDFKDLYAILYKQEINARSINIFETLDAHIIALINSRKEEKKVEYISLVDAFHLDTSFFRSGDCITYHDTDHFSSCGEIILSPRLYPVLTKLIK